MEALATALRRWKWIIGVLAACNWKWIIGSMQLEMDHWRAGRMLPMPAVRLEPPKSAISGACAGSTQLNARKIGQNLSWNPSPKERRTSASV